MVRTFLLALTFILTSCGAYQWWGEGPDQSRKIASIAVQELLLEDKHYLSEELDEKLLSIHSYYLIGQKNLMLFDSQIADIEFKKLYESGPYLNLIAVRTQAEAIEHELVEIWGMISTPDKARNGLKQMMEMKIGAFAKRSPLTALSMENLTFLLGMKNSSNHVNKSKQTIHMDAIEQEYKKMERMPEFIVYEKNIVHLSHMLNLKIENEGKRFFPDPGKPGNITGNEFPAKVWSLTFDDGPGKLTSPIILKNLQEKGLAATFFQLTSKVNSLPELAKQIRDARMEIGLHSYTHQQLTKVGQETLEKEITGALQDLRKIQGIPIKFFRLPYGAGVSTAHIREKIAANNLIHVFWNIDTLDWMAQEPGRIVERTLALMKKNPKDAGILLFHDIHQRTADATPHIMDHLKRDGRRVCTLDEIVTQMNEAAEIVCPKK